MARQGKTYFDNRDQAHATPEDAVRSDLAHHLGKLGPEAAARAAEVLLAKRTEVAASLAEYGQLLGNRQDAEVVDLGSRRNR